MAVEVATGSARALPIMNGRATKNNEVAGFPGDTTKPTSLPHFKGDTTIPDSLLNIAQTTETQLKKPVELPEEGKRQRIIDRLHTGVQKLAVDPRMTREVLRDAIKDLPLWKEYLSLSRYTEVQQTIALEDFLDSIEFASSQEVEVAPVESVSIPQWNEETQSSEVAADITEQVTEPAELNITVEEVLESDEPLPVRQLNNRSITPQDVVRPVMQGLKVAGTLVQRTARAATIEAQWLVKGGVERHAKTEFEKWGVLKGKEVKKYEEALKAFDQGDSIVILTQVDQQGNPLTHDEIILPQSLNALARLGEGQAALRQDFDVHIDRRNSRRQYVVHDVNDDGSTSHYRIEVVSMGDTKGQELIDGRYGILSQDLCAGVTMLEGYFGAPSDLSLAEVYLRGLHSVKEKIGPGFIDSAESLIALESELQSLDQTAQFLNDETKQVQFNGPAQNQFYTVANALRAQVPFVQRSLDLYTAYCPDSFLQQNLTELDKAFLQQHEQVLMLIDTLPKKFGGKREQKTLFVDRTELSTLLQAAAALENLLVAMHTRDEQTEDMYRQIRLSEGMQYRIGEYMKEFAFDQAPQQVQSEVAKVLQSIDIRVDNLHEDLEQALAVSNPEIVVSFDMLTDWLAAKTEFTARVDVITRWMVGSVLPLVIRFVEAPSTNREVKELQMEILSEPESITQSVPPVRSGLSGTNNIMGLFQGAGMGGYSVTPSYGRDVQVLPSNLNAMSEEQLMTFVAEQLEQDPEAYWNSLADLFMNPVFTSILESSNRFSINRLSSNLVSERLADLNVRFLAAKEALIEQSRIVGELTAELTDTVAPNDLDFIEGYLNEEFSELYILLQQVARARMGNQQGGELYIDAMRDTAGKINTLLDTHLREITNQISEDLKSIPGSVLSESQAA